MKFADISARPSVEVRADGELIRRLALGAAEALIARGWACWRATGRRRYLELTPDAPLSSWAHSLKGRDGTRPVRGDGTGKYFGEGQLLGNPEFLREHAPTR
jgi:hypothetical protein